jgi:hypothetical protein
MLLSLDARARRLLTRRRPGQVLTLTIVSNYGLPGAMLTVEWRPGQQVEHDPDLVYVGIEQGAPIFAHRRLAAYARWRPLCLTAHGPVWWPVLTVAHGTAAWRDLARWEQTHPGLTINAPAATHISPAYAHIPAV